MILILTMMNLICEFNLSKQGCFSQANPLPIHFHTRDKGNECLFKSNIHPLIILYDIHPTHDCHDKGNIQFTQAWSCQKSLHCYYLLLLSQVFHCPHTKFLKASQYKSANFDRIMTLLQFNAVKYFVMHIPMRITIDYIYAWDDNILSITVSLFSASLALLYMVHKVKKSQSPSEKVFHAPSFEKFALEMKWWWHICLDATAAVAVDNHNIFNKDVGVLRR